VNEREQGKSNSDKSDHHSGLRLRLTPSLVLWGVLAVVAVVLLAQNTEETNVDFFGWRITAPLFVIIGAALLIGWGLGELGTRVWRWRRRDR
jgi:uncharacterized integral membrane protein